MNLKHAKVALVYDRVNKWGGAERLLLALHEIFPSAPLFTSVYNPQTAPWASSLDVHTSFLQKITFLRSHHELFPFLMPFAFESFDFSQFDLVITVTSAEAKGVITKPGTLHVCFCLTPTRYLWVMDPLNSYHDFGILSPLAGIAKKLLLPLLRKWDLVASTRPDAYLSISNLVSRRLQKIYSRTSRVVYPPFNQDVVASNKSRSKSYFLCVTRLVGYKRIDLAISAANRLGIRLKIVGTGQKLTELKLQAGENVELLGFITEKYLPQIYAEAKAVIIPGEEEFCLTALEAQANGVPVIAYANSGVSEIIIDDKTGIIFQKQDLDSLIQAILKFSKMKFHADDIRRNALRFSREKFKDNLLSSLNSIKKQYDKGFRL